MPYSEADYIIVGGGLTGCTVAARLQNANPSFQVLVLEAGTDATENPQTRDLAGAFALAGSELDYNYKTATQPNTNNRTHTVTAGKVLGGGSTLNYGAWTRADASDYDQWARVVDDERWSYTGCLPYLKKAEQHLNAEKNSEHRGSDGPIRVTSVAKSDPKRKYGLRERIKAAWEELGLQSNSDGDCGSLAGIRELLENWYDGQRQPSYSTYGLKASNIITGAMVHKVIFAQDEAGHHIALSVITTDGQQYKARREIILCAGTVRTPQILMLSGIGPSNLLSKHNIPVLVNNQEVGRNYFDHFELFQTWKLRDPGKGLSMGTPHWDDPAFHKGMPCDWAVNDGVPPNLLQQASEADANNGKETNQSLLSPKSSYLATSVMLLLPTSRGSVYITSASPMDAPAIDPNFYDTETDRTALIHGVRRVLHALLGTSAGKSYIKSEVAPPDMPALTENSSDTEIDARIRMTGLSHAHAAGTAAMGKVVDTRLRVKGVRGLRVADASIFPTAMGGHPQATLYGVAEHAADIILQGV